MKKLLLTGSAALLLATGTHALDYRPQYDTRPWEAAEPPEPTYVPEREYGEGVDCMKLKGNERSKCISEANGGLLCHDFSDGRYNRCITCVEQVGTRAQDFERCMTAKPKPDAVIPKQYRGEWCATKWKTIYKRCRSGNAFSVLRDAWGVDDESCTLTTIRKSRYGGHRLFGTCSRADPTPEQKAYSTEERWWLGSNNTRLQVIVKDVGD
jgi:hypothetical protein